jgi:hypothetical protein
MIEKRDLESANTALDHTLGTTEDQQFAWWRERGYDPEGLFEWAFFEAASYVMSDVLDPESDKEMVETICSATAAVMVTGMSVIVEIERGPLGQKLGQK